MPQLSRGSSQPSPEVVSARAAHHTALDAFETACKGAAAAHDTLRDVECARFTALLESARALGRVEGHALAREEALSERAASATRTLAEELLALGAVPATSKPPGRVILESSSFQTLLSDRLKQGFEEGVKNERARAARASRETNEVAMRVLTRKMAREQGVAVSEEAAELAKENDLLREKVRHLTDANERLAAFPKHAGGPQTGVAFGHDNRVVSAPLGARVRYAVIDVRKGALVADEVPSHDGRGPGPLWEGAFRAETLFRDLAHGGGEDVVFVQILALSGANVTQPFAPKRVVGPVPEDAP